MSEPGNYEVSMSSVVGELVDELKKWRKLYKARQQKSEDSRPEVCMMCAKEIAESELRMANGEYYTLDELKTALLDGEENLFPEVIRLDDLPDGCELRWAERDKNDFYSFPNYQGPGKPYLHRILIIPPVKS